MHYPHLALEPRFCNEVEAFLPMSDSPQLPDARPVVRRVGGHVVVAGTQCLSCRYPSAFLTPRCPDCTAPTAGAEFGPLGGVWASTIVRIPVGDRIPPYGLAYVDLKGGPRVLVHLTDDGQVVDVGADVELVDINDRGDLVARLVSA